MSRAKLESTARPLSEHPETDRAGCSSCGSVWGLASTSFSVNCKFEVNDCDS